MCRHAKMTRIKFDSSFCLSIVNSKTIKLKRKFFYPVVMFNREGKVSLATFSSGILATVFTSIVFLNTFSLELNSFQNFLILFIITNGTYALFCVIMYFVTSLNDFEVLYIITRNKENYTYI